MTDRGLWCRILRRFCKRNSIPYNFFPINNYTYWGIVRFFAEWPMQWRHKLGAKPRDGELDGDLPGDNCVRKFDCRDLDLHTKPTRHSFSMRLVPGGRYLVVDDARRMNIWDLGLGAGAECICLASVVHELPKGSSRKKAKLEVYPAPDGHDFRVLVFFPTFTPKSGDVESDIGAYEIYNVHPLNPMDSKNDEFQIDLLVKAFNEATKGLYAVTGDLYASFSLETNTLTVWNIISGTMESIDIENSSEERVERIFIRESPRIGIPILIVVKMSHVAVYGFSPCLLDSKMKYEILEESSSNKAVLIIPVNLMEQVRSDFSEDSTVYWVPFFDFPPRWYETSDRPLIMDLVCCSTKSKKYQHRWRYELSFDVSSTTLELSGSISLLRKLFSEYLPYQRNFGFSDDHIFIGCVKSNEAAVTYDLATPDYPSLSSSVDAESTPSYNFEPSLSFKECKSALLLRREVKHDMDMMRGFELCVISGRICFFTRAQPYVVCIIDQYTLEQPIDE